MVLGHSSTYTAAAKEAFKGQLKINWSPTNADTSHSGLNSVGGRENARTRRGRSRGADSWRVRLGISTREKSVCISGRFIRPGEQGLRQNNRAENLHQPTRRWGTQDAALQIAWISLTLPVCSCRRPVTKSVYDIEIGFSSGTCVGVRSASTGPGKVELLASAFGGQMGHALPRDMH
jgi:hypothetical protein